MKFAVEWLPDAETELADIWLSASDRKAITQAAFRVDRQLATDPLHAGESRFEGRRIYFERPLMVLFRVLLADLRVEVSRVVRVK